jgi:hypothetical protein
MMMTMMMIITIISISEPEIESVKLLAESPELDSRKTERGKHPASYLMGTEGCFPSRTEAGA